MTGKVPRLTAQSRYTRFKFEGEFIKGYDAFNHLATLGLDLWWRRATARTMGRDLPAGGRNSAVLDLACGTGDMSLAVARVLPQAQVVGSDPSATMLAHGRKKVAPWAPRVAAVRAVTRLPFADGSFAAITVAFGVRNFVQLAADMQEALRLLRQGGRLYVLEFFVPRNGLIAAVLRIYNALVFPFLGFLLTGRVAPYRYLFNSIFTFKSVPDFAALLQETGFADIRVRPFFFGMVHLVSGARP